MSASDGESQASRAASSRSRTSAAVVLALATAAAVLGSYLYLGPDNSIRADLPFAVQGVRDNDDIRVYVGGCARLDVSRLLVVRFQPNEEGVIVGDFARRSSGIGPRAMCSLTEDFDADPGLVRRTIRESLEYANATVSLDLYWLRTPDLPRRFRTDQGPDGPYVTRFADLSDGLLHAVGATSDRFDTAQAFWADTCRERS